ncbi:MAG: DUF167 domain-containing protein [Clostridia bacterium]|nr:DUF167 domain-containing protein [Clostridia bacterium]
MVDIKEYPSGVTFKVRVQPRAAKNQLAGVYEDAVKVRLTAPPVDGEANEALLEFLAKVLGVAKSQVELVSGHTGRNKVVRVSGITLGEAREKLGVRG